MSFKVLTAVTALLTGLAVLPSPTIAQTSPASAIPAPAVHPGLWPKAQSPIGLDAKTEARITQMLSQMTLEEKIGQILQPEIRYITPDEVRAYHIGTIENGGGSFPGGDKHAAVQAWVQNAEAYYQAAKAGNHLGIPLIWATDAVHGHNNVFGATLYPHNVGLGAAHDPELIHRIGEATAAEVRATGLDWAFAPTIAVARDRRWGRAYESYSEDPRIVEQYAAAMVIGLQGSGASFLDQDHVIATAKHFLGDGSTDGGRDQGDSLVSETELSQVHGAGYRAAVDAGVQSIMASYNSWRGVKMHANAGLMTDVLKQKMGFDGMIMGDWNAHGQIPGCTDGDCAASLNAGLDVYNVPIDWKELYGTLNRDVKSGKVPISRLDDAVRRILRVKLRAGAFSEPSPARRPGSFKAIGTPQHRALAREAVRKSLVLLKNNNGLLPLKPGQTILVAGDGADNIAMQTGGWTLSWQGNDNGRDDFPGATSIYQGLKAQAEAAGGQVLLSPDGASPTKPDVAIVVFGETPYAEFQGDQADTALHHDNAESLALLKKLKSQGIPVVAVLLSGRPLYANPQINAADAFVAAFLPGSEGEGIADVLLAKPDGTPQRDFNGRLSFSWPRTPHSAPLNIGDKTYDPQFAFGYGLTYAAPRQTPTLVEVSDPTRYGERNVYFTKGGVWNGYRLGLGDGPAPRLDIDTLDAPRSTDGLTLAAQDDGAAHLSWSGKTAATFAVGMDKPSDVAREANGSMMISLRLRLNAPPTADVRLGVGSASVPMTGLLKAAPIGTYVTVEAPLTCFAAQDLSKTPTVAQIQTAGTLDLSVSDIRLVETKIGAACPKG